MESRRLFHQVKRLLILAGPFLTWLSLAFWFYPWAHAEEAPAPPPDIVQFYRGYNFVAAFTTFVEQAALQGARLRDVPQPDMSSPRMKEVREQLSRLDAKILRSDPGIKAPGFKGAETFPHGFLRITAARCGPSEIVLQTTVQRIAPAAHAALIAAYEKAAPRHQTDEEIAGLLNTVQGKSLPKVEIHKWMLTDGVWKKQEADVVLLEGGGEFIGNC